MTGSAPAGASTLRGAHVWRGIIEEYRDRMPVDDATPVVSLREGGTPLIVSEVLSELTGCEVHLKYDGVNPTGSFKDRGMTMAITKAKEAGAEAVICASTGNTSASAAAYAGKAGLTCGVIVPEGKIALGKLAQALVHGAKVIQIDGNFDQALLICRQLAEEYPVELVNSVNPYRIDGQRSGAWEVCDQLGRAPDVHVMPVGNAGNITAYWRGYREYLADGLDRVAPGDARLPGRRRRAPRHGPPRREAVDHRDRHPHRQPRVVGPGHRGRDRLGRVDPVGHRPRDHRGVPPAGPAGRVRRDGLRGLRRRAAAAARRRRARAAARPSSAS